MIRSGICSVTLSKLSVEEIVNIVKKSGLEGIEWWGKDHVPHGDIGIAKQVKGLTEKADLKVSSYGSYYKTGVSEDDGLSFQKVLDTAVALSAPTIRVWAGNRDYAFADKVFIEKVVKDTMRIAEMASKKDTSITFEYHGDSLTDNNESAIAFAAQVLHPNVYFSWQSPHGFSLEHCLAGLEGLLDRLSTIHVYHWTVGSYEENKTIEISDTRGTSEISDTSGTSETIRPVNINREFFRHPFADGIDRWKKYFDLIEKTGREHFALLEFVKGDSPDQVVKDAEILNMLLG